MEGLRVLSSFLQTRGQAYHKEMSSPNSAFDSCSRLSPYVAYGALSMREVVQATRTRIGEVRQKSRSEPGTWRAALSAFSARLHWHCHFIQKLEDECGREAGENADREGSRECETIYVTYFLQYTQAADRNRHGPERFG